MKSTKIKNNKKEKKSFLNFLKDFGVSKSFVMFLVFAFLVSSNIFAADGTIETLDNWGNNILKIFSSGWVKALACVALIIEAIGMIVAGNQGGGGQIIKKFAPWIIGTVILLTASGITSYFLGNIEFDEFSYLNNQVVNTLV